MAHDARGAGCLRGEESIATFGSPHPRLANVGTRSHPCVIWRAESLNREGHRGGRSARGRIRNRSRKGNPLVAYFN